MPKKIDLTFSNDEELLKRIEDLIIISDRRMQSSFTPFLKPNQIAIAKAYLKNKVEYDFFGGYLDAEMKMLKIDQKDDKEYPLVCLKASYRNSFISIAHKDVLGALMGLQINRNRFGDILVLENEIILFVHEDLASFIIENLTQIHKLNIRFEECYDVIVYQRSFVKSTKMISSLRLDSVVASLAHLARTKAQNLLEKELVYVNDLLQSKSTYIIKSDDIISIRKYGKFKIEQIKSEKTKKGHFIVEILKYE